MATGEGVTVRVQLWVSGKLAKPEQIITLKSREEFNGVWREQAQSYAAQGLPTLLRFLDADTKKLVGIMHQNLVSGVPGTAIN